MEDDDGDYIGCGDCHMPFDSQVKRYDHEPYCPNKAPSTEEEESEEDDAAMTDAEKDDPVEEVSVGSSVLLIISISFLYSLTFVSRTSFIHSESVYEETEDGSQW